jgi:excisionase family DNA binding protein
MRYLHSIQEACYLLNIGRTKLYELVAKEKLKLVKIGAKSLITDESARALVAEISGKSDAE